MANGVERWITCSFAIPQLEALSDGYHVGGVIPTVGWNSDYSCDNPEIVDVVDDRIPNVVDKYFDGDGKEVFKAIQLYPFGNTAQPNVSTNLELWCGNCPFYKNKNSQFKG